MRAPSSPKAGGSGKSAGYKLVRLTSHSTPTPLWRNHRTLVAQVLSRLLMVSPQIKPAYLPALRATQRKGL